GEPSLGARGASRASAGPRRSEPKASKPRRASIGLYGGTVVAAPTDTPSSNLDEAAEEGVAAKVVEGGVLAKVVEEVPGHSKPHPRSTSVHHQRGHLGGGSWWT